MKKIYTEKPVKKVVIRFKRSSEGIRSFARLVTERYLDEKEGAKEESALSKGASSKEIQEGYSFGKEGK